MDETSPDSFEDASIPLPWKKTSGKQCKLPPNVTDIDGFYVAGTIFDISSISLTSNQEIFCSVVQFHAALLKRPESYPSNERPILLTVHSNQEVLAVFVELTYIIDPSLLETVKHRMVLFPGMLNNIPENPVTFASSNEQNLPLPSSMLFAIHRACARVAHLSGAEQHVDDLLDLDDTDPVTHDGPMVVIGEVSQKS
ncbi:hypothetical protein IW261DRAFT_1640632 [Armillaria novae-zelandiae]|uniref:Uncharacterized protein n=1 Tax=Armillaria novae-zelandiae TaxID=153914 RepID=A0AA39NEE0_9AGAR|nr:hypothetical protein IW261DRAFT_1427499 [Armillaria novae-zelandiae]KAK0489068.1 hypothetical protein IW261DRAFT_1640632 [Armillaria novae-zelandiae]